MASNGAESRTLIRSVIDALRGTPGPLLIEEDEKEDSSDSDLETGQGEQLNQLDELADDATDIPEMRYGSQMGSGRHDGEVFAQNGSSTDPRIQFQSNDPTNFYLPQPSLTPGLGFLERGHSSSSVHEPLSA